MCVPHIHLQFICWKWNNFDNGVRKWNLWKIFGPWKWRYHYVFLFKIHQKSLTRYITCGYNTTTQNKIINLRDNLIQHYLPTRLYSCCIKVKVHIEIGLKFYLLRFFFLCRTPGFHLRCFLALPNATRYDNPPLNRKVFGCNKPILKNNN